MNEGLLRVVGKRDVYKAVFLFESDERRRGNLDVLDDSFVVYAYCCPRLLIFKSYDDRAIDIAFLRKDFQNNLYARQVVHCLPPGQVTHGLGQIVVEGSEGSFLRAGINAGVRFEMSVKNMGRWADLRYVLGGNRRRFRKDSGIQRSVSNVGRVAADREIDVDLEVAKEIFMYGFRGKELVEALRALGITGERLEKVLEKLKEEVKSWDMINDVDMGGLLDERTFR
jgi:hypothetical protein